MRVGGLHLIRALEHRLPGKAVDLTLVDRQNYHLFTPLLYQVATGELPPHAVAYPLRLATALAGYRFIQTEIEAIDVERHVVRTADGDLPYDHVVVAPGSVTNDYGIPGVAEHAVAMKWLADGEAVRKRVIRAFEDAAIESDAAKRKQDLTFVLIGAGPVGVELASSLRDLMDHTLRRIYPTVDFERDVTIHLLDAADRVLPSFDPRLGRIAMKRLEQQKIRVLLKAAVSEIRPGLVRTKEGAELRARTIVWSAGVKTNPLLATIDLPKAKDGRLLVDARLRADGRDDVLSLGDAAAFDYQGRPLPQLAQVAVMEAKAAARNVAALVRGQPAVPYVYRRKGDLIALGRTNAGAELALVRGSVVMSGLPAWTVWRGNYLLQLLGVRNRATLLMEWVLSYFSGRLVADAP
ncbi:MAG: NAD(P)/FAD-dependent oxidoreductase [Chloroflexi bacterium]|nr:MAG: NAD(P)/FAD-dependent oxidoreductase [Chloroflexota bacterium]